MAENMNQVIPNLWIGNLKSAQDAEGLKENGIQSIVSVMRWRVALHHAVRRHQINIDDVDEEDVLVHFMPAIAFIQAELDKGRGVLVHCQAGMSRSVTIVAAYLMYTQKINCDDALELIRKARPTAQPNSGFLQQLEIFHSAAYEISHRDKATRMFYMEKTVGEIMNRDGTPPTTKMFASLPRTVPGTSGTGVILQPRRRIRCKMCRQELAAREHMLDHGQLGPPTPSAPSSLSPAGSRSLLIHVPAGGSVSTSMARIGMTSTPVTSQSSDSCLSSAAAPSLDRGLSDSLNPSDVNPDCDVEDGVAAEAVIKTSTSLSQPKMNTPPVPLPSATEPACIPSPSNPNTVSTSPLTSPSDLAAQLYSNPKLAGLRSPATPQRPPGLAMGAGAGAGGSAGAGMAQSPPILVNPKCSGYFVEPMKWMESFLQGGQLVGKIICPNKKCGAKLGSYDWAGVCCGCREWVTPGFCINRSKVDEVV